MTSRKSPLETAENAILAAEAALNKVQHYPAHPVAKMALQRAREALLTASSAVHLAQLATTETATGRANLPPGQAVAAL